MSILRTYSSIAILALLASVIAVGVVAMPVHATEVLPCELVFETGTTTGITPGTTGLQVTYLLMYPTNYPSTGSAASFGLSAKSSNSAWTVASVSPLIYPGGDETFTSIYFYPVTVTVNAPATSGSTTTLTVNATDEQSEGRSCSLQTVLTTSGTPASGVPEFPLGMLALIALALPAMILLKRKFSVATPA